MSECSSRSLDRMPPEIILSIAESLDIPDLNSLLRSSRHLAALLDSYFYRCASKFTFVYHGQRFSPLSWAAEHGRLEVVRKLLNAGADARKLYSDVSAFHLAIENNHPDIARVLVGAGADPFLPTRNGVVQLIRAATRGQEETVRLLLEVAYVDTPVGREEYKRAVGQAVYSGHLHIVKAMLDKAAVGHATKSWFDLSRDEDLMYTAARVGNCDMIRLLLDYGAIVPPVHRKSTHPLVVAAQNGHKKALQVLIAASVDPTYEDKRREARAQGISSGRNAAAYAIGNGISTRPSEGPADYLFHKYGNNLSQPTKDGRTPLQIALEDFSRPDVIHLMLDRGANPNVKGRGGSTALHTLVRLKRHDLLETMLSASKSLEIADDKGYTPLLLATIVSNKTAASLFLKHGANIMAKDNHGRTPLHIAAFHGSIETVTMLLDEGADMGIADNDGRIALHHATFSGSPFVFKAILSRHDKTKTSYLVRSHTGRSVLDMVAEGGHLTLLRQLLEQGVDVKNHPEGYSALHAAVANRHRGVIELLLTQGANPVLLDYYGRTPLDLAVGDGAMFATLSRYCQTVQRTAPGIRLSKLKESVVEFASRALYGQTEDVYKLAKCLVYLKDGDAALAVFRQAAKLMANSDDLRYPMSCNGCRKRLKETGRNDFLVLVCRRCHDLDESDFADTSPFLGFYSTDAGFAVDTTGSTSNNETSASWRDFLEHLIAKHSG